jgi:hypothetical protein
MRVFADGHFIKGIKKYPSLRTCDIIEENADILLNGKQFKWKEIKAAEIKNWNITDEKNTP